jgi:transposase
VILYEDEAIVTDEPTITAKWGKKGSRPVVSTDTKGKRKRRVIFGAVNPETGKVNELGNIELMYLPPYCSDLNAIEHLWKDLRRSVTHNFLFDSIKQLGQGLQKYFVSIKNSLSKVRKMCKFIV